MIAVAREGRNQLAEQMARERQEAAAAGGGDAYPGYARPGDDEKEPGRQEHRD